MKLYAWRQDSSGNIVAAYGQDRFAATEVLCNEYPDADAADFYPIAEGEAEFMEVVLNEVFGGIAVLRDTSEV